MQMPSRTTKSAAAGGGDGNVRALAERLRAAVEVLESAAADQALLAPLSVEERMRLIKAAGDIYCPDVSERRRLVKARVRQRKAEKVKRDQGLLGETGIRKLRREKVFTTPNLPPPPATEPQEIADDPDFREVVEPQNCYICKRDYSTIHHFYDQLCSARAVSAPITESIRFILDCRKHVCSTRH